MRGLEFDQLMRHLTSIGFVALLSWTLTSAIGTISGYLMVPTQAALRFLLAVLVLVFARRTYWEFREWHWRKLPPDERYGFANPLWEHPRSWETRGHDGNVAPPET